MCIQFFIIKDLFLFKKLIFFNLMSLYQEETPLLEAQGYIFKIWKSYQIYICQPKFGLYSCLARANKTINFRLWNF